MYHTKRKGSDEKVPEPIYYTASTAALWLNCSAQNVRRMERAGQLKAIRTPNGVRLFSKEDVLALVIARKEKHEAQKKK